MNRPGDYKMEFDKVRDKLAIDFENVCSEADSRIGNHVLTRATSFRAGWDTCLHQIKECGYGLIRLADLDPTGEAKTDGDDNPETKRYRETGI